jgi:glycine betaine/proline transport system permease protein
LPQEAGLESWFTVWKLPLGWLAKQGINWLQDNASGFFDLVTAAIDFLVDGLTGALSAVPTAVLIFVFAALAYWLHRSWRLTLFVIVAFLLITNLGYWQATLETISLVGFSTLTSVAFGVPIGIACAHRPWL